MFVNTHETHRSLKRPNPRTQSLHGHLPKTQPSKAWPAWTAMKRCKNWCRKHFRRLARSVALAWGPLYIVNRPFAMEAGPNEPLYIVNRPSAMQAGPNPLSVMQDVWKPCARQRASQTETPIYHARRWIISRKKKIQYNIEFSFS